MGRAGEKRKPVPARVFLRANMTLLLCFFINNLAVRLRLYQKLELAYRLAKAT